MSRIRDRRRGATIQEAVATVALAMAVVTGVSQLLGAAAKQWLGAQQRSLAVRETGNFMEDLISRPWADLAPAQTADLRLPAGTQDTLPQSQVRVTAQPDPRQADLWQIQLEVSWLDRAGRRSNPVRLTAWRHRFEEARP